MVEVPLHGAREHHALQVAALLDERGELVVLRDAGDVLLDDGAFVEGFGDVVAGGADELDAAREGRVVGARAGEGGQERVVDVDDAAWVGSDELPARAPACSGLISPDRFFGWPAARVARLRLAGLVAGVTGM